MIFKPQRNTRNAVMNPVARNSSNHPTRYQIPDTPPNSVAVGAADVLSRVYEVSSRPEMFKNYSGTLHLECQGTLQEIIAQVNHFSPKVTTNCFSKQATNPADFYILKI